MYDENNNKNKLPQEKNTEYFIKFFNDLTIHIVSCLTAASVKLDQYGAHIIENIIVVIEKYLKAIWKGTTSAGPNKFAIIKLSLEKIIIPDI